MKLNRKRLFIYSVISAVLLAALALLMVLPFQIRISYSGGLLSLNINTVQAAPLSDWQIKFNPTGTHIKDGSLKIRLDFYPSESSNSYKDCYVYMPLIPDIGYQGEKGKLGEILDPVDYQRWLDLLPHTWQLNPAICVFVTIPADVTEQQVRDYASLKYNADTISILDDSLFKPESPHLISPYMRDKTSMTSAKIQTSDESILISSINNRLDGLVISGNSTGVIEKIIPESIDVGPGATDRSNQASLGYTVIDIDNPANATGIIDTYQIYPKTNLSNVKAGLFYGAAASWTCRDSETLGTVTAGLGVVNFTGLSVNVSTSDCTGIYGSSGDIEADLFGGTIEYISGEYADPGDNSGSYGSLSWTISIYATGTESGGAPAITNTPASRAFGTLYNGQTYFSNNLTLGYAPTFALADAQCYFTVTNSGTASGNITASATNFTGGVSANLTDSHPDANHIRLSLLRSGDANISANTTLTTTPRAFITSLAASATKKWEIMIETPTSDTAFDNVQKTCTITLSISSP